MRSTRSAGDSRAATVLLCVSRADTTGSDPGRGANGRLGRQVVRVVGEELAAVLGDEDEVLQAAAAEAFAVEARFDGEHVAGHDLVAVPAQAGQLVHLEADAVAEAVEEALLEHLPWGLRELGGIAVPLEELAN